MDSKLGQQAWRLRQNTLVLVQIVDTLALCCQHMEDMAWISPVHNRGTVDAAGKSIIDKNVRPADFAEALGIVNNWRSSHGYPLQAMKMTLRNRARSVDSKALIAQRLKRLASIEAKLRRFGNMKLSQMQDLGGCRSVVESVGQVHKLVGVYETSIAKNPNKRAEFVKKFDYIAYPKADGYRSIHYIYKYRSQAENCAVYNGLRIEVQIRSQLQHAWATAVETVDAFTGQALKSNRSFPRIFSLASQGSAPVADWEAGFPAD